MCSKADLGLLAKAFVLDEPKTYRASNTIHRLEAP